MKGGDRGKKGATDQRITRVEAGLLTLFMRGKKNMKEKCDSGSGI